MKFLLPLLLLSLSTVAQETTWYYSGFTKISSVYSIGKKYKSTRFDTVSFKGSLLKIRLAGDVWYLDPPLSDTLLVVSRVNNCDTTHAFAGDTVLMNSYGFRGGIVGFYEYGMQQANGAIIDHFYLVYPEKYLFIPEVGVPRQYWDYKVVSYVIDIVRKQATYSN